MRGAQNRGRGENHFYTNEYRNGELFDDHEAYFHAVAMVKGYFPYDNSDDDYFDQGEFDEFFDEYYNLDDRDLIEELEDADISDGSTIVLWIKRGSKKIYDSGIDERALAGDDEEDW